MKPEMSNAEAITRIDRFLAYLEEIWTPQCDCEEALIRRDDVTAFVIAREALKDQRPHGEWVEVPKYKGFYVCSKCLERLDGNFERFEHWEMRKDNFCHVCGSDNRPRKHGCSFADEECKKNPCKDCGLKEGE